MELASTQPTPDGYQSQGRAWDPFRPDILPLLRDAVQFAIEPIYYGSNRTFLVELDGGEAGRSFAVYKPARGEYPLYDFPTGTLYRREIGSYLVCELMGWHLVPPTVLSDRQFGDGSLQLFIEARTEGQVLVDDLRRLALLDVVLNNADRKGEHCLVGDHDRLWGIDHGLTFHPQPKLRTVLWHFAGEPIEDDDVEALERLLWELQSPSADAACELRELLNRIERRALVARVERLLAARVFPNPQYKSVPYRW
jgi:hypothetical protein